MGSKHQFNPTLVFFFEIKTFSFQKNLQVLDQMHLKKISKSQIKWTGVECIIRTLNF